MEEILQMIQVNEIMALPKDEIIAIQVRPVWKSTISPLNLKSILIEMRRAEEAKLSIKIRRFFDIGLFKYKNIIFWIDWVDQEIKDGSCGILRSYNSYVSLKELLSEDIFEKGYSFRVDTKVWKSYGERVFPTEAEVWEYLGANFHVELLPKN